MAYRSFCFVVEHELITKWRTKSEQWKANHAWPTHSRDTIAAELKECADELEAALRAAGQQEPPHPALTEELVRRCVIESTPVPLPTNVDISELTRLLRAALAATPATRPKGQCHSLSACLCCYGTHKAHEAVTEHCQYCELATAKE